MNPPCRRGRCVDPTSAPDYYSGAARLRQYMLDNKRWPVDDGYLDAYVTRVCGWSQHFTWAAINQASLGDVACVRVAENVTVDEPLHVIVVSTDLSAILKQPNIGLLKISLEILPQNLNLQFTLTLPSEEISRTPRKGPYTTLP